LERQLRKMRRKNWVSFDSVISKIDEIVSSPDVEHYKNQRAPLNEFKGVHVLGNSILMFKYDKRMDRVLFYKLEHHDDAYKP
jgi:mRNA-degrading endonuclease RelE of RelBE toxin-antitoxin system